MKKLIAIAGICLVSVAAFADTKPSDASLNELLTLTDSKALVDGMWPQVEGMMNNAAKQALGNTTLNNEQQKVMEDANAKVAAVFKEEFSYDKMKPMMVSIYKESFSQEEVDGMIAFYKSKAGQAVTKKMPIVMQSTMANVQAQMSTVIPKIQKIQQDAIEQVKAKAK
ncbi:hypothetical protein GCM10011613_29750 [Cellvibrio zantedeschiae]|uniref:DUF2059 domain-containing protein n=1 Tax=Cellvibrio zantedeschiae TaxID=1237077 RepID=A0ABQ3BBI7_9GAMM|nr:DUF2059 domain-containing protein [Cellvibrio zantedeschiae]GGY82955.1 hypothetical protein GCM10011613_29750 [Cellvibrio zantedeschiae]